MKKKIKKAFTLVELLVVIAILAILATVSIVGYNSFTKKARVSNDTALVSQLNNLLKADEILNESVKCPTDALKVTEAAGYDVEKLTPTATGYQIIWNQDVNQFALLDEKDNVVYGDKNTDEYKNWKFVDKYIATDYSVYLKGTSFSDTLDIKSGLDVGNNTNISTINYKNDSQKDDVIIRTNGGALTIDGATDTIKHYGTIKELEIKAIFNQSYHEYGTVVDMKTTASTGRIVIENGGLVNNVSATTSGVTYEKKENGLLLSVTASETNNSLNSVKVTEEDKKNFKYEISSLEEFISFRDSVNSGMTYEGLTIRLTSTIDLNNQNWLPIGNYRHANGFEQHKFKGTFDGQGHTINNLFINGDNYPINFKETDSIYGALFGYIENATIKNFKVNGVALGTDVGGVVGAFGANSTIENVTSYVEIGGKKGFKNENIARGKVAGIAICTKGDNLKILNCINYGNINATEGVDNPAGGIIAYVNQDNLEISNCENYGAISASQTNYVGGIVGCSHNEVVFKNCKNNGNIIGKANVGGIVGSAYGTFNDCENKGNITAENYAGGIVGCLTINNSNLTNCNNSGEIRSANNENSFAGGIVGWAFAHDTNKEAQLFTITFENCKNTSNVIVGKDKNTGQIIGSVWYTTSCSNKSHNGKEEGHKVIFKNCGTDNLIGTSANANSYTIK